MKVVLALRIGSEHSVLDAHLSYHLNAGVDFVIAAAQDANHEAVELLEPYILDGHAHVVRSEVGVPEYDLSTRLAGLAVTEHAADWVIDSDVNEFWWPRAESLKDALVAIPPRYTVVQALVRRFLPAQGGGPRTTRGQLGVAQREAYVVADWLRPVYRASAQLKPVQRGAVTEPWRVPLRAWYPIEVFDFADDARASEDMASDEHVSDTRLVDALARLQHTGELSIPVPDIVEDAAYAVECAALGEADFGPIEAHIADLEERIAALEAPFWPGVARTLRRLVPRRR
jgi:hypothetical protein